MERNEVDGVNGNECGVMGSGVIEGYYYCSHDIPGGLYLCPLLLENHAQHASWPDPLPASAGPAWRFLWKGPIAGGAGRTAIPDDALTIQEQSLSVCSTYDSRWLEWGGVRFLWQPSSC